MDPIDPALTEQTALLRLPYIMPSQAQKHVTHNEALRALDALVQIGVVEAGREAPPDEPVEGDRYIVGPAPSGAWEGQAGTLVAWQDGAWAHYAPRAGWLCALSGTDRLLVHDGADWRPVGSSDSVERLGVGGEADANAALAVRGDATVLGHAEAGDHRLSINRETEGDVASVLFQTGWSGRAEIGLVSGGALSIRTSADGQAWSDLLRASADGERIETPGTLAAGTARLAPLAAGALPAPAEIGPGGLAVLDETPPALILCDGAGWFRVSDGTAV